MLKNIFTGCVIFLFLSCSALEQKTVRIWTDRPEFALYAQVFNAAQDLYKAEVQYYEFPNRQLSDSKTLAKSPPDLVAASWLRSASTRVLFKPLDELFTEGIVTKATFYSKLLELGFIEGQQYLLPLSFNLPALVFAQSNTVSSNFTITIEEIREKSKEYNKTQNGAYTRMGFSPSWDDDFLFASAVLHEVGFREAAPLDWNEIAMQAALDYDRAWTEEAGLRLIDDFAFRYFFDTPAKRTAQGRVLFSYMNSAELFTLDYELGSVLDFRWLAQNDTIPVIEGATYYGIYSGSKAKKASEAFTKWLFQSETQALLLKKTNDLQIVSFGIAGGFSSLRNVNEEIFPRFYPNLLGHIAPEDFLSAPAILPMDWTQLKERVILPFMHEYIRAEDPSTIRPLDKRISDWYRINK